MSTGSGFDGRRRRPDIEGLIRDTPFSMIAMAQESHTVTLSNDNSNNARIHVPVSVMRENGLDLSDEVEVTVSNIDGLVDQISFERPLMSAHGVCHGPHHGPG